MNDYRIIFQDEFFTPLTTGYTLNVHRHSVEYIRQLSGYGDTPIVVVTHHGPTLECNNPLYANDLMNGAFYSDLVWLINERPNIKYWICGHTHYSIDFKIDQCHVLSNQRGYFGEKCFENFNGTKSFEIS